MIRTNKILLFIFLFAIICSCKNHDREFPQVKNLSQYPETTFLPTLENKVSMGKNAVYCATLLYAWDKIRSQLSIPLHINSEQEDLILLNSSESYLNVLNDDEYSVNVDVIGDSLIKAEAAFKKSLPFRIKLNSFKDKLKYRGVKVASFGFLGYDKTVSETIEILYYNTDNDFLVKILPKESNHEVMLLKSDKVFGTMAEMVDEMNSKIAKGKEEQKKRELEWKYVIAGEDELIIPKLRFNIETNYKTIEEQVFYSEVKRITVEKAWQRTAFILDEVGAEAESEVSFWVKSETSAAPPDSPQPKKMVFDKPFFVALKRSNSDNPYFGLWVYNEELMEKE